MLNKHPQEIRNRHIHKSQ